MTFETTPNTEQDTASPNETLEASAHALLREMLNRKAARPEVSGDTDDGFVNSLRTIKQVLDVEDGASVIYPGSGVHAGVARVFGKEYVVHVDPDGDACKTLDDNGYVAVQSTIEDYAPHESADGIVALNSYGAPSEELIDLLVKPGGFVVANNYTHWASALSKMDKTLELVGAMMPAYQLADTEFVDSSKIPEGAMNIDTEYLIVDRNANITAGTPDNFTFQNDAPRYPDALFAFRRIQ
jgi:hypothetical protein